MNPIEHYIRTIENYPKEGIQFKDITPLLLNPNAVTNCLEALESLVEGQHIDKVIGIESRGFFFGSMLAHRLRAGFIPVRKPGKLPYQTISETYALEYGTDTLEIHIDAIDKGDRVLIHDDVLATGGTAQAVCNLVESLGGVIVQCNFIMELSVLGGREKLSSYPLKAVLTY